MRNAVAKARADADYWLYFLIGSLGGVQTTHAPEWAKELASVLLLGLLALKAKRSGNGKRKENET